MVKYIESMDEFKSILEVSKTKLVVIDFTASWCGPCKMISPIFEQMASENPEVEFVKVDVDETDDVAGTCGIRAMPTFQFYKGGEKVEEMMGMISPIFEQMASENPEVEFVKVDVDETDDVAGTCGIRAMPTFQFYKGGEKGCGPCKMISPIFEQMASENPEVEFVKVDVDETDDVAGTCGIRAMPTFQFYKGGEKVEEMMGADVSKLKQLVAQLKKT
eukprot:CAMPEP_0168752302 /NCGR_PEP_ID=MMETSP0724-20121128/18313_1 /TAXON_ID=265536 /ORGANISM="Amphiprora sp., Strain CCMP467" /LENGTH=217 /DNA_ID=CAMNT_0008800541 /DNA_START=88 /DNA_END=738 /DNA_ORIENTATION=-